MFTWSPGDNECYGCLTVELFTNQIHCLSCFNNFDTCSACHISHPIRSCYCTSQDSHIQRANNVQYFVPIHLLLLIQPIIPPPSIRRTRQKYMDTYPIHPIKISNAIHPNSSNRRTNTLAQHRKLLNVSPSRLFCFTRLDSDTPCMLC